MLLLFGIFLLLADITIQQYGCIAGYNWYFLYGQCIPSSPTCNIGYTWNGRNCLPAVYCANSTYFDGNNCVDGANGCPNDFIRWRTFCLNCPAGFNLNTTDQSCFLTTDACASDYYWNGRVCASRVSGLAFGSSSSSFSSSSLGSSSGSSSDSFSTGGGSFGSGSGGSSGMGISITGGVQCQAGYYWTGANCVINNGSIVCLVGFYWNGYSCASSSTISTNCSQGYYFNGASCVANDGRIICLSGFQWDGFLCKGTNLFLNASSTSSSSSSNTTSSTSSSTSCPNGFIWNGTSCIASSSSTTIITNQSTILNCPVGQYFNGQTCMPLTSRIECFSGFTWGGLNCIRITSGSSNQQNTSTTNVTTVTTVSCPPGYFYNGQTCLQLTSNSRCLDGFQWNGTICIRSTVVIQVQQPPPIQNTSTTTTNTSSTLIVSCPSGYYYNGAACYSISSGINCLPGFLFNGTACIRSTSITTTTISPPVIITPPPSTNTTSTTIISSSLQCPIGSYFTGRSCQLLTSSIYCQFGYQWNGITCVLSNIPLPTVNQSTTTTSVTTNISTNILCPSGFYYNGQQCIRLGSTVNCVGGYIWNSNTNNCVPSNQQTNQQINQQNNQQPNQQITCFNGYTNVNGVCQWAGLTSNICPIGNFFNGVNCAPNTGNVVCANGFTWNTQGTQCISAPTSSVTTSSINTVTTNYNNNVFTPQINYSSFPIPITTTSSGSNLIPITNYPPGTIIMDPIITQPLTTTFVTNPIITQPILSNTITNFRSTSFPILSNPIYSPSNPSSTFVPETPLIQPINLSTINSNFSNTNNLTPIPFSAIGDPTPAQTCALGQYWNGQRCVSFTS